MSIIAFVDPFKTTPQVIRNAMEVAAAEFFLENEDRTRALKELQPSDTDKELSKSVTIFEDPFHLPELALNLGIQMRGIVAVPPSKRDPLTGEQLYYVLWIQN